MNYWVTSTPAALNYADVNDAIKSANELFNGCVLANIPDSARITFRQHRSDARKEYERNNG